VDSDYEKKKKRRAQAYKDTFKTEAGRKVLADLKQQYYDCPISPAIEVQFAAGQRDVVREILFELGEI
jgi:hypothetical protein